MTGHEAEVLYNGRNFKEAQSIYQHWLDSAKDEQSERAYSFNIACCLASAGELDEAGRIFARVNDNKPDSKYNEILLQFKAGKLEKALELSNEFLAKCYLQYPELEAQHGRQPEFGIVEDSCIVPVLNLQFAILYELNKELQELKECLDKIPIKDIEQLDAITLHNQAINEHYIDLPLSISKLEFIAKLSDENEIPPNIYRNLLILYDLNESYKAGSDFLETNCKKLEENVALIKYFEFAFSRKNVAKMQQGDWSKYLDELLDSYCGAKSEVEKQILEDLILSIVTKQSEMLWKRNKFAALEALLARVRSVLAENKAELLRENQAHSIYMSNERFEEASLLYEQSMPKGDLESLLEVNPIVLSNLCVTYVMTGRNKEAETLIKEVELEEDALHSSKETNLSGTGKTSPVLANSNFLHSLLLQSQNAIQTHLSTINLIIGTLYCVKSNFSFGLTRIFKTFEPMQDCKLNSQSWYQVKRCILALLELHCKQMILIKDDLFNSIVEFLIECEKYGIFVPSNNCNTVTSRESSNSNSLQALSSVTCEARYLRSIVLALIHDY